MSAMQPPDQPERSKAVDVARSPLVSAPAGSGKTSLLVLRFLRLLAHVEQPEAVLAITFTRKAAGEMRRRVVEALAEADKMQAATPYEAALRKAASEARKRHPELADQPARLLITTFDAFAGMITRRYPLAAGVGRLAPTERAGALYREAALAAVEDADDATLNAALAVADGDLDWLVRQIASWLMARETLLLGPQNSGTDPEIMAAVLLNFSAETLKSFVEEQLEYLDATKGSINQALEILARGRLAFLEEQKSAEEARKDLEALQDKGMPRDLGAWPRIRLALSLLLTKEGALRKAGGATRNADFVLKKEDREELGAWLEAIAADEQVVQALALLFFAPPELDYDEDTRTRFAALYALYAKALRRLEEVMRARGRTDFTAVIQGALRALPTPEEGGDPSRLERLDAQLAHVLVDEFQDVSPVQREFLARICYGFDGEKKTLFCVGDPMQSIYRFRKAEPEIFLRLRQQIARPNARQEDGLPLSNTLELKANFRSARGIVDWVNATFAEIAPHEDIPEVSAARFTEAEATNDEKGEVVLHLGVGTTPEDEAEHALRLLRAWLNDHPGERIAVLGRSRTTLEPLVRRLRAAGVPFRAVDIFPLGDEPAARWVRALAVFAASGFRDSAAFASLLRSPLVGLDTTALARLLDAVRQASENKTWTLAAVQQALQVLPQQDRRRVEHLLEVLVRMTEEMRVLPVALAVERALVRLGAFAWLDERGRRDLSAALDALASASEGGVVRLREFEEALEHLYAAPDASEDAARLEVLTMHGAKGLEWDAVLLFGLGRAPRKGQRDGQPKLRMARVGGGVLITPPRFRRSEKGEPGGWEALVKAIENERERQEALRLLYVACTRAKKRLHLVGSVSEEEKPAGGSLLAFLGDDADGIRERFPRVGKITPVAKKGEEEAEHVAPQLVRVAAPVSHTPPEAPPVGAPPVFGWAGVEAHALGEALHRLLEEVARIGLERWEEEGRKPEPILHRALAQAGAAGEALEKLMEQALAGWEKVRTSKRGRWLLSGKHEDAHAEWELVVQGPGGMPAVIRMDRSFVDEEGTRWVVDYKASFHEGGDLERFLEEELYRYRPQLERYVQAVKTLEPHRPVRAALYFPLMDAWQVLDA